LPQRGWYESTNSTSAIEGADAEPASASVKTTIVVRRNPKTGVVSITRVDHAQQNAAREIRALSSFDAADCIAEALRADALEVALGLKSGDQQSKLRLVIDEGFSNEEAAGLAQSARSRLRELPDQRLVNRLEARWFKTSESRRSLTELWNSRIDITKKVTVSEASPIIQVGDRLESTFKIEAPILENKPIQADAKLISPEGMARASFKDKVIEATVKFRKWATGVKEGQTVDQVFEELDTMFREEKGVELRLELQAEIGRMGYVLKIFIKSKEGDAG
jgi:hypothetical protein